VILFSDGVSDHLSLTGDEYGRSGLAYVVRRCCDCPPQKIVEEVFADLDNFNMERFDDQTLIVMRVQSR
jgi:serine phosphatase RsbU (regulator of sigma subunit)